MLFLSILLFYTIIYFSLNPGIINTHWFYYISPPLRLIEFFSGLILAKVYLISKKGRRLTSCRFASFLEISSIAILTLFIYFSKYLPLKYSLTIYYLPITLFIIFVFAQSRGEVSKLLSGEKWITLGNISLSFYFLHWLIIKIYLMYFTNISVNFPYLSSIIIFIAVLFASLLLQSKKYLLKKIFKSIINKS